MKILGIETSCDETAAAVVENGTKVLSNIVSSSEQLHRKYGGIVPEVAAREQVKVIIPVIHEALTQANETLNSIDALAVTYGPGLIGSLLVGVETAKALAWVKNKPLIKVNHLLAHVSAVFLDLSGTPIFPFVALIVSGGHTDLVLFRNYIEYEWLGGTRDDAAGEAFDKVARLLDLGYPGGPVISKLALSGEPGATEPLPRPIIDSNDFDFSFSGLKTAVMRRTSNNVISSESDEAGESRDPEDFSTSRRSAQNDNTDIFKANLAFEFQEAVTDVLVHKAILAGKNYDVTGIALCGGVSANKVLREKLTKMAEKEGLQTYIPNFKYSTDNAAMVASRAFFAREDVKKIEDLEAEVGVGY